MNVTHTPESLIAFEEDIAACYNAGQIRAPIHLHNGNEEQLIQIFKDYVEPDDWVLCSWRSHYHCLLKGVPPTELKAEILAGRSIALCFPKYRLLSSAIVGGTAPIALGLALGIKRRGEKHKVVCFIGDMTAETGVVYECAKYAANFDLPLLWVVEDNGKSTNTPTVEAWGLISNLSHLKRCVYYRYQSKWPHSGAGRWVVF